jgi:hypothetical protein
VLFVRKQPDYVGASRNLKVEEKSQSKQEKRNGATTATVN